MKILEKTNGFKTIAGGILHLSWFVYYVFFDKSIDVETKWTGHGIIGILTGIGITHKIKKAINQKIK